MHNCATRPGSSSPATSPLIIDRRLLARIVPFAVFMSFIAVEEGCRIVSRLGWLTVGDSALHYLYAVKAVTVAALLFIYRDQYREFRIRDWLDGKTSVAVLAVGLLTFVMWIFMDWGFSVTGAPKGFNPWLLPEGELRISMTAVRVAGAALVVPLMEELFWRSFLLRYLVDADFEAVPVGRFTWASFLVTTVLFGLEHHLILAGMVAGAIYNIILYKTRSIAHCVLAHAVTNLALACYVLYTGRWDFW